MTYRSEIDGLRALAVLAVVGYHAGVPGFAAGFLGVDIFFVISGYLITGIIARGIEDQTFTLTGFYQRRVRRIFPALAVMMAVTLVFGHFTATPAKLQNLGGAAATTALSASNFFFWKSVNYFSHESLQNPLLHTWSLAVEEQFYLFFPLLLIAAYRFAKSARLALVIAALIISFAAAVMLLQFKPSAAFYLLPTRAWELLAGALLSVKPGASGYSDRVRVFAVYAGTGLMLVSITGALSMPGLSIVPMAAAVAGSVLFILGSEAGDSMPVRLFRWWPVVLIGQASYSFYLWHQPILAYADYLSLSGTTLGIRLLLCLVAFAISLVSLSLVERPFRSPRNAAQARTYVVAPVAALAVLGWVGTWFWMASGVPGRLSPDAQALLDVEKDKDRHPRQCLNVVEVEVRVEKPCVMGDPQAKPEALLWGDSHAMVTATALEAAALRQHSAFEFVASVDCPIGLGFSIDAATGPDFVSVPAYQNCDEYNSQMLEHVRADANLKTVVLSSRWTNWRVGEAGSPREGLVDIRLRDADGVAARLSDNSVKFEKGFRRLLAELQAIQHVTKIVIVGPVPDLPGLLPESMFVARFGFTSLAFDVPRQAFEDRNAKILALISDAAHEDKIKTVWPHEVLCDRKLCHATDKGILLYFDDNHLSLAGAQRVSHVLDSIFQAEVNSP